MVAVVETVCHHDHQAGAELGRGGGYLTNNPLRSFKRPASGNRTQLITDEQHTAMVEASDEHFQLFLTVLRETGARPSEISAATAADVDPDQGICVLKMHKTVKKTGKPRSSC